MTSTPLRWGTLILLAIVLARDRSELGIVSLQDILKAIFGEVKL